MRDLAAPPPVPAPPPGADAAPENPLSLQLVLVALLAVLVVAAFVARRRRSWHWLAAILAGGGAVTVLLARYAPGWTITGVAIAATAVTAGWCIRRGRTSATVTRWGARSRRKVGVASAVDITRVASATAMRRKAAVVRPTLQTSTRRGHAAQLLGVGLPATEIAVELCRVGPQVLYASVEDVVAIFGGPRTGKTSWLAGRVLDAPGAALVTSTRTDLHDDTSALRRAGGPVYVFNPGGLGDLESTATFDPLTGCADPTTAAVRAADLLSAGAGHGGDREFWDTQARRVLAALLHAAALDVALGIGDVLRWVAAPDDARRSVLRLLDRSPETAYAQDAAQFLGTNDKTRSSITSTIMPALGWLTSPPARAAADPGRNLDVAGLLERRGTVYLLGAEETHTAPLVTAFTGHIAREARRIAATSRRGRLDPPLTLALDEAALICPVPLNRWSSDMGGRGVTILASFQSRAQLLDRYGDAAAAEFMNNAAARMVFGGGDRDDLEYWSTIAGDRDEPVVTTDDHGKVTSRTVRKVPVVAPAQLANLPFGRVVLFRRGMPPAVGRVRMAWKRRDVRTQTRAAAPASPTVAQARRAESPAGDEQVGVSRPPWGADPAAPPAPRRAQPERATDPAGPGGGRRG